MIPQGVPASLVGCLEPVPYVMAEDMVVLPLCRHPRSLVRGLSSVTPVAVKRC